MTPQQSAPVVVAHGQPRERHTEADVLQAIDQLERDQIDELVDAQLCQTPDDYHNPYSERCPQCGGEWHGLRRAGCPGATGISGRQSDSKQVEHAAVDGLVGREGSQRWAGRRVLKAPRSEMNLTLLDDQSALSWTVEDPHFMEPLAPRTRTIFLRTGTADIGDGSVRIGVWVDHEVFWRGVDDAVFSRLVSERIVMTFPIRSLGVVGHVVWYGWAGRMYFEFPWGEQVLVQVPFDGSPR